MTKGYLRGTVLRMKICRCERARRRSLSLPTAAVPMHALAALGVALFGRPAGRIPCRQRTRAWGPADYDHACGPNPLQVCAGSLVRACCGLGRHRTDPAWRLILLLALPSGACAVGPAHWPGPGYLMLGPFYRSAGRNMAAGILAPSIVRLDEVDAVDDGTRPLALPHGGGTCTLHAPLRHQSWYLWVCLNHIADALQFRFS